MDSPNHLVYTPFQRVFMRHWFNDFLFMIIILFLFASCESVQMTLTDIPEEDQNNVIYLRDGFTPGDDGEYATYMLSTSTKTPLIGHWKDSTILTMTTTSTLTPSISADGKYFAVFRDKEGIMKDSPFEKQKPFGIFDVEKQAFAFYGTTAVSCSTPLTMSYEIPWSYFGHSVYQVVSDTLKKCMPEGKKTSLMYIENLAQFSISPSEHWLLFSQGTQVGLMDLTTSTIARVKAFDKILGLDVTRCIRTIAWSPDEKKVAFAEGFRITIFDLENNQNYVVKVDADVFDLEWATNDEFIYVEGYLPYQSQNLKGESFYGIYSHSLSTKEDHLILRRDHHEPVSIKPKVSPSGRLLLFSEREAEHGYQVKLMTVRGDSMMTVCSGYEPVWGK